jgi:hypothetical protein
VGSHNGCRRVAGWVASNRRAALDREANATGKNRG